MALNHEEIEKHTERITKIKPFINKYKWVNGKEQIFHQKKMIGKNLEKNNVTTALNVLYVEKDKIYLVS